MPANVSNVSEGYELVITRVFDAPRELVWKAWTDPAMAKHWMGPRGFAVTEFTNSMDAGGHWRLRMSGKRFSDGQPVDLAQGGRTLEADPPRRLVYTFAWDDRSAVGLGESTMKENIVTITLEEQDGKTHMEFRQTPFATEGERDGHNGGWSSGFEKLAELLAEQAGNPAGK